MDYTAAFITRSGVSENRFGQRDVGLMGLEENVAAAAGVASRANKFAPTTLHGATRAGNAVNV